MSWLSCHAQLKSLCAPLRGIFHRSCELLQRLKLPLQPLGPLGPLRLRPWQTTKLQGRLISGAATCPETAAVGLWAWHWRLSTFYQKGCRFLYALDWCLTKRCVQTVLNDVTEWPPIMQSVCSARALLTMVTSKPPCRYHTSGKVSNRKSISKGVGSNRTTSQKPYIAFVRG